MTHVSVTRPRRIGALALAAAAAVALSACGASGMLAQSPPTDADVATGTGSSAGRPAATRSASASVKADPALAALVPQEIRDSGELVVDSNPTLPPMSFKADDGTVAGVDADLAKAIAGRLGLRPQVQPYSLDGSEWHVLGRSLGDADISVSSSVITASSRWNWKNVQYMKTGLRWIVRAGNPTGFNADRLCGHALQYEANYDEGGNRPSIAAAHVAQRVKECAKLGLPEAHANGVHNVDEEATAVTDGSVEAAVMESPAAEYVVARSNGALELAGTQWEATVYGIHLNTGAGDFADLISRTLASLADDGTYGRILEKWGLSAYASSEFPVDPSTPEVGE
ncbi:polar amino acid ABC transporter, binding protein [Propionibacterium freudenreichii]|uniref:Serine/threonine-protein kinase PknD n=1 Tax=Propionibacterium freudenreichii TaxID=1744 RepID=A0A2C7YPG2_9ACTN|nr:transporter substrate-binding domain-containing protein [Propionibacterium freudenreichii]MDK9294586.1 transporter substrate-binding domain-containing protein [Propionibacterium freudenreichii]MDK9299822.1 transporter substrate-binding domain-containing protein [Propionibacterium freudenreichii]MDK9359915.1 transporter substrate-binding domain-containing protein [Propionibacterium freudenreichii]MDK9676176.1 transporter substrate-binding domain-containing protein [Propionibacterium freudenre